MLVEDFFFFFFLVKTNKVIAVLDRRGKLPCFVPLQFWS